MAEDLMSAVRAADQEAVVRLATAEVVNLADAAGVTPLMLAARLGRASIAAQLLACGADVRATDARGYTALFHACHDPDADCGRPDLVRLLLEAGADKEAQIGFGVRPLMYAAGNGEADVVTVLLDAGADPLARNEIDRTALMMVKDRGYIDVINLLHEAESLLGTGSCNSRNAPDQQVVTFLKPLRSST